jgi:hypothetical protein
MDEKTERNRFYKKMRKEAKKQPLELQKEFITESMKIFNMQKKAAVIKKKANKRDFIEAEKLVKRLSAEQKAKDQENVDKRSLFDRIPMEEV